MLFMLPPDRHTHPHRPFHFHLDFPVCRFSIECNLYQHKQCYIDEFITQKLNLKHTQTFRPCHTVFSDGISIYYESRHQQYTCCQNKVVTILLELQREQFLLELQYSIGPVQLDPDFEGHDQVGEVCKYIKMYILLCHLYSIVCYSLLNLNRIGVCRKGSGLSVHLDIHAQVELGNTGKGMVCQFVWISILEHSSMMTGWIFFILCAIIRYHGPLMLIK